VATETPGSGANEAPGLFASLRRFAATAVDILRTRLELLAAEVEEESLRLAQVAFWGLLALFFLALAAVMLTLLVVVVFWDSHRITAIALLCIAYGGAGVAIAAGVRSKLRSGSKLFSASLAEFDKDRERLKTPDV
jgi:uncharacterized membrane protein YqjE